MQQRAAVSPRLRARIAGGLYLLSVLTAACAEIFLHGRLGSVVALMAIAAMVGMTLLFYSLFKQVSRSLALLAVMINLTGLVFEAVRWNPLGIDLAIVLDGLFCLLIGYLVFQSNFLPRVLGVLMALAGLAWLTFVAPRLANDLSPYNLGVGILGEGSLCLWLLFLGVADRHENRGPVRS
jgi:Domain of unknown function (DUF4386)